MADGTQLNTNTTSGDIIATDDITDGGVADSQKAQRVKVGYGVDNNYKDANHTTPFPVIGGLASPQTTHATSASVAAGSSVDLDSDQISVSTTGELVGLIICASVPWKAQLKTVLNGVESSTLLTLFGQSGKSHTEIMYSKKFFTQAYDATAGLDGFRVTMTNLDTSQAADLYTTFLYDEV